MSYHEYMVSRKISAQDHPFYALIMSAMRQADSDNIKKLKFIFPSVYDELYERYHAPGGLLESERKEFEEAQRQLEKEQADENGG